ncbi:integrin alpha-5-like [Tachypleus tridentatus]|uniref:integrin alpha-5-like n=1 Tax=Tachypleus tridentatus TaxID=6853 RepID=UPI003FD491C2
MVVFPSEHLLFELGRLSLIIRQGMYLFSVFLTLYISKVFGFNIDINFPLVYKSSGRDSQKSYFGYSVAFHQNNDGKMILVTAPKAKTTVFKPGVIEPGVLYKCPFKGVGFPSNCVEVEIDRTGNDNIVKNGSFSYEDLKNNMWLGVTMDVQRHGEKNVVVRQQTQ